MAQNYGLLIALTILNKTVSLLQSGVGPVLRYDDVVENDIKLIFWKMRINLTLNLDTDYGYHGKNP